MSKRSLCSYGCRSGYEAILLKLCDSGVRERMARDLSYLSEAGDDYLVYCGRLSAPLLDDVMKRVVGRGGCYFKRTTLECDIDFIWHDREKNEIEFWGPKNKINHAMNIIESRIDKIGKIHLESEVEKSFAIYIKEYLED